MVESYLMWNTDVRPLFLVTSTVKKKLNNNLLIIFSKCRYTEKLSSNHLLKRALRSVCVWGGVVCLLYKKNLIVLVKRNHFRFILYTRLQSNGEMNEQVKTFFFHPITFAQSIFWRQKIKQLTCLNMYSIDKLVFKSFSQLSVHLKQKMWGGVNLTSTFKVVKHKTVKTNLNQ